MPKIPLAGRPLLLALAFVLTPAALAQSALATGPWTGSIEWRDAEPVALSGRVETCTEGLRLILRSEDDAYQAEEVVRAEEGVLRFGMANTQRRYALACTAAAGDDGAYAGRCSTPDGVWARLRLQPPAQATIGCSE